MAINNTRKADHDAKVVSNEGYCSGDWGDGRRKTSKSKFNLLWLFGEPSHDRLQLFYRVKPKIPPPSNAPALTRDYIPRDDFAEFERLFPEAEFGICLYFYIPKPNSPINYGAAIPSDPPNSID